MDYSCIHEEEIIEVYRCCFCAALIMSNYANPCEVDVLTNFGQPKNKQYNQVFYCHMECLKAKMHPYMQQYYYIECLVRDDDDELKEDEK